MMANPFIKISYAIEVNPKDKTRCSRNCPQIEKKQGLYVCTVFNDQCVDVGEDDDIGYGFKRVKECIENELNDEQ